MNIDKEQGNYLKMFPIVLVEGRKALKNFMQTNWLDEGEDFKRFFEFFFEEHNPKNKKKIMDGMISTDIKRYKHCNYDISSLTRIIFTAVSDTGMMYNKIQLQLSPKKKCAMEKLRDIRNKVCHNFEETMSKIDFDKYVETMKTIFEDLEYEHQIDYWINLPITVEMAGFIYSFHASTDADDGSSGGSGDASTEINDVDIEGDVVINQHNYRSANFKMKGGKAANLTVYQRCSKEAKEHITTQLTGEYNGGATSYHQPSNVYNKDIMRSPTQVSDLDLDSTDTSNPDGNQHKSISKKKKKIATKKKIQNSDTNKDHFIRLKKNINELGYKIRRVDGEDGNCFFHCINDQLVRFELPSQPVASMRTELVDYLQKLNKDDPLKHHATNDYLNSLKTNGNWVDAVAVRGMSRIFKRNIIIVTSQKKSTDIGYLVNKIEENSNSEEPFLLGLIEESHYISLEQKTEKPGVNSRERQTHSTVVTSDQHSTPIAASDSSDTSSLTPEKQTNTNSPKGLSSRFVDFLSSWM